MIKQLVTGFTLLVVTLGPSQAAPLYDSTYDLMDANPGSRGIWLNNGGITVDGVSDHTFSILNATFDGGLGNLSGSTKSNKYNGGLNFDVDLTHVCTSGVTDAGGNKVSVDNAACGLTADQPTGGAVSGAEADGNTWDFWNYDAPGMFTLTGWGVLDGLSLTISQKPGDMSKPFRFGIAADWDNETLLGGSGWFNVDSWSFNSTCLPNGLPCPVVHNNATAGDFNVTARVPEPPVVALFALGLLAAGFGAVRSKQRR